MVLHKIKQTAHNSSSGGIFGFIFRVVARFFQFVLALTVAGLYGQDLHKANKVHVYADSKWVFAEVVAGLSAVTTLIYFIPLIKSWWFFAWDIVLFILWTAVFGVFAKLYINENPEGDSGVTRMKNAVWVDLANLLLWLITGAYGAAVFFINKRNATLHTGRAEV